MKPLDKFASEESLKKYPPISASEHAAQELEDISLKRT